jgi:hypothetical protein
VRGLWRWWETKDGADHWWARVEVEHGAWTDVAQGEYESKGLSPAFWDLPLQQDYMEAALADPLEKADDWVTQNVRQPGLIILMLVGAVMFIAVIMIFVMLRVIHSI